MKKFCLLVVSLVLLLALPTHGQTTNLMVLTKDSGFVWNPPVQSETSTLLGYHWQIVQKSPKNEFLIVEGDINSPTETLLSLKDPGIHSKLITTNYVFTVSSFAAAPNGGRVVSPSVSIDFPFMAGGTNALSALIGLRFTNTTTIVTTTTVSLTNQ